MVEIGALHEKSAVRKKGRKALFSFYLARKLRQFKSRPSGVSDGLSTASDEFSKIYHGGLVDPECFCYMHPRRSNSAYHDAVVAELVDAQR
ncbi:MULTISPECIES: hypothetical protein [unclassified Rhizobium]|uniref:hypothetical protein n=1 Tax=unclassified Rhizobium TaxID=2613769 RepID=UPI0012E3C272|nr:MULTISPECIES: hypothetical protein [unclassified Rhizobium]